MAPLELKTFSDASQIYVAQTPQGVEPIVTVQDSNK